MSDLKVAKASYEAALYAVEHWHYSRKLPRGKLFIRGVWEDGKFIGVVIFSHGATQQIGSPFGLEQHACVELTRVALTDHQVPVTQVVAASLRDLHATNPDIRVVVSYADPQQGHHGGIYQAGNWIYLGQGQPGREFIVHGERLHSRVIHLRGWKQSLEWLQQNVDPKVEMIITPPKHKYVMPMDKPMRKKLLPLAVPYPPPEKEPADARGS